MTSPSALLREARAAFYVGDIDAAEKLVAVVSEQLSTATAPKDRADLAHRLASYFRDTGQAAECEVYARIAIEEERQTQRDALLGNHLMFLADRLASQRRYDEALPFAQEAFSHYAETHGPDHRETGYIAGVVRAIREHRPVVNPIRLQGWVERYEWGNGLSGLWPIIFSEATEFGTALMIYWRLRGPWLRADDSSANREARHMAAQLIQNLNTGVYPVGAIRYDPVADLGLNGLQVRELMESGVPVELIEPKWPTSDSG